MNNATEAFNQAYDNYLEPRKEEDINLVSIVRYTLISYGLLDKVLMYYDTDENIISAANRRPEIQRYILNNYLTLQLMMTEKNSMDIRYGLLPGGDIEDWLSIFRLRIAPFMADNDLPKKII